jgi:hypothetical protein
MIMEVGAPHTRAPLFPGLFGFLCIFYNPDSPLATLLPDKSPQLTLTIITLLDLRNLLYLINKKSLLLELAALTAGDARHSATTLICAGGQSTATEPHSEKQQQRRRRRMKTRLDARHVQTDIK